MSGLSNAQLAAQVSDLLTRWNAREDQVQDWLGGTATGGPQGDGRYPLSNARGDTNLIPCPAALAATASGPAAVALGHRDGAEAARDEALSEADRSEAQRVLAESAKAASIAARDLTLQYRDRAANAEANAEVHRQYAEAARAGTAADLVATADHRDEAEYAAAQAYNHKVDAAASAAAAGNYNPALYATRADGLSQIAGLQAALDARLLTSGFTWAALPGKPSTFAPSAHGHVIADVTGLQSALDGKQAAGSYAPAAHGHVIADITGLQAALDAKLASSSFTWTNLSGKPSTFAPSAHSHVIADTTGLQAALDGKQASGSYSLTSHVHDWSVITGKPSTFAPSAHSHVIADTTGLQAALDAKVSTGSAATVSSLTVGAAASTTGIIYLGQNQTAPAYLYWNGGAYAMPSGPLLVNGSTVWTAATFNPADKANLSGAYFTGDVWTSAGGSFRVLEANASRANQVYVGADGGGGYIHATYGSGGTSAFRVICEGTPRIWVSVAESLIKNNLVIHNEATFNARSSGINVHRPSAFGQYASLAYDGDTAYLSTTYTGGGAGGYAAFVIQAYDNGSTPIERLRIARNTGNFGIGLTADATSRLQVSYENPASVPAAGATGHVFAAGSAAGYGLAAGVLNNGHSYLQSTRWDGVAANYPLLLQPNGGNLIVGSGNVGIGTGAPNFPLVVGGQQAGNAGLEIAPGSGVVIQGYNRTAGAYSSLSFDGSSIAFRPNGSSKLLADATGVTVQGELKAAEGTVYTSGGLIYSTNWWRSTGQTGWFNASYGTGIWSITGGEVRTYNGSRFHSEGDLSSGGVVQSGTQGGFRNAGYVSGRNRIWSFANADAFGLSYYQGAGGWSGMDTISFHFGNTAEASTLHKFRSDGVAAHAGDLYVKGSRLPVFTSSTGSPSGGVDGDIHITY